MTKLPSFQYFYNSRSTQLDVVMPGISGGIGLPLMQDVIALSKEKGHSVLSFDYLFYERGEDHSSGDTLPEEQMTLRELLNLVHAENFDQVCLIGKSLGGILANYFLKNLSQEDQSKYSVIVLGYAKDYIDLKNFPGKIAIIQGGKDKNGDIEAVKNHLQGATSNSIDFYGIPGASHGFSDPETKEPLYTPKVIEILRKIL